MGTAIFKAWRLLALQALRHKSRMTCFVTAYFQLKHKLKVEPERLHGSPKRYPMTAKACHPGEVLAQKIETLALTTKRSA